ncbi:MAG TPA: pyridoxal phosphate-dependent aminotransferase [Blastocatellia bacterium]|nr:pyridoxal phosphate-dependent aminotransferase [Blastocatellia bacterium]
MTRSQFADRCRTTPELSRRSFSRMAMLLTAGATLPFYNETTLAQLSKVGPIPPDAVKINANENPLGPCPEAAEAIAKVIAKGGRYWYEETDTFAQTLADQEGLDPEYVAPFAGSSDPLHRAVLAFTSKERPYVTADPGYEAGMKAAKFVGAKVIKVPLTQSYAHDVKAMVKAAHENKAGLIYICNPNNPTGTTTPRADLEYLVNNKPEDTIVLLDEAYIHLSEEPFCSDLASMDKDVVILRTFSKLYGMAGLRAGAAIGRPDLLGRIRNFGAGALPVTGMVGATASLKSKTVVTQRRQMIKEVREDVFAYLQKHNFSFVPSVSNCFMLDAKMPARKLIKAMEKEKIYIGRVWPSWPTHTRISIGTRDEMAKFKTALLKVMNELQV